MLSIPLKAQLFWQICCICHIKNQIKAEPSSQSAKQTFVISCAGKNLGKCKQHKVQEKDQNISLQSRTPCNKVYKISVFPPWLFLHKLNLFVQRCKADKETRAHTRTQIHKEDVPEDCLRGGVPNQTDRAQRPCPDAFDFRLGNVKQTQKQEPAMRVLGWVTEAASKYWDCVSPVAMVTKTGWILAERERKLGRQWVLGDCLNVCMWRLYWGWRKGERRESRWKGTFQYRFVLGALRALSLLHTKEKHISKSPSKIHAVPKNTALRCGNFTFARWQAKSRQFILSTKRCNTHCESTLCVTKKNSWVVSCWEPQVSGIIIENWTHSFRHLDDQLQLPFDIKGKSWLIFFFPGTLPH